MSYLPTHAPCPGVRRQAHRDTDRITRSDADAVLSAGWSEKALHDAVSVCGLFNLMNRLVSGLGITVDQDYFETSGDRLAVGGYVGLADLL